jgi:MFS family permease
MQTTKEAKRQGLPKPVERDLRLRTMRASLFEGSFSLIMQGLADAFYVPYLTALGATTRQVAFGVALPFAFSAAVQLLGLRLLYHAGSRRKLIMITTLGQALCFIPLGLAWQLGGLQIWAAMAAFTISAIVGNIGASAWADWLGSVVPRRRRGKYFSFRNRLHSFLQIVMALAAGRLLDYAAGKVLLMFTAIWCTCTLMRLLSCMSFRWHWEPELPVVAGQNESFGKFLRGLSSGGFGKFTLAMALINFGATLAGPFFTVHMIRNLHWSYAAYTILIMMPTLMMVLMLGVWGRAIDKFSSVTVLRLCSIWLCLIPLPWILTNNYWVLLANNGMSGLAWGGLNLAAFTYYTAALPAGRRLQAVAHYNAIVFAAIFAGTMLGGVIEPLLPMVGTYQIQSIFLVSSLARFLPAFMMQGLAAEQTHRGYVTMLERFFFDPKLTFWNGVAGPVVRFVRKGI